MSLDETRGFYGGDHTVNYVISALVCDYVASTRGEDALWGLVDSFVSARGAVRTEEIVRRELGASTRELSRQALAWARSA